MSAYVIIVLALITLSSGFIIALIVARSPNIFWALLIMSVIVGSGPMISGYTFYDMYLLGCLILGCILLVLTKRARFLRGVLSTDLHRVMFLLLMTYLAFQSVRGMLLLDDWRMIRYVVLFIMIGLLSFIISRMDLPLPSAKKISLLVVWSGIIYFALYLIQGRYFESVLGPLGRFVTQGNLWSGSAYAIFPIAITLPAAIFLLAEKTGPRHQLVALVCAAIGLSAAIYFDSRVGELYFICCLIVCFLVALSPRKLVKLLVFVLVTGLPLVLAFPNMYHAIAASMSAKIAALSQSALFLLNPRISDLGRAQQFYAAVITLESNWLTMLFGNGFYSHRLDLLPALISIGGAADTTGIVRPTGISAFLVDTGLVGLLLWGINIWLTAHVIIVNTKPNHLKRRTALLFTLFFTFIWMFVSNMQTMILYYLMFMPAGLLVQLSRPGSASIR